MTRIDGTDLEERRPGGSLPPGLGPADIRAHRSHLIVTPSEPAGEDPVGRQQVIPVLRVFDHALAKEFYCDLLGFEWRWQHQFEPDLPVYAEVERDGSVLHLSEHHGDATPGSAVMIVVADLRAYQEHLLAQRHRNTRPGISEDPWGLTMTIADPFGNKLTFWQRS